MPGTGGFVSLLFLVGNIVSSSGLTLYRKILDKYKIMDSLRLYQIILVLFVLVFPTLSVLTALPPPSGNLLPSYSISYFILLVSCYSLPKIPSPIVPLYFPGSCVYSIIYAHISKLVARNH